LILKNRKTDEKDIFVEMKKGGVFMKRKGLLVLLTVLLIVGSVATYYVTFKRQADNQACNIDRYNPDLFGIGEPIMLRRVYEKLDLNRSIEAVWMLGVKWLREWTRMGALLINQTALN